MTSFFNTIFTRYPIKTRRLLELFPGLVSWTLILLPLWGGIFFPVFLSYFIVFFDVYWLYKSLSLTATAFLSSNKIREAEKINWLEKANKLNHFSDMSHIVVIPNFKERIHKLRETLQTIAKQSFPAKRIYVVLAMEDREEDGREKSAILIKEFKPIFGDIFASFHPDIPGEVKGKSSNESFGAKEAYQLLVVKKKVNINYTTISSVDADSIFDKQYFAYLSHSFLTNPKPHNFFWQSANVNYNNFWSVPAPVRILSFFGSLWRTALLIQGDRLVSNSTYSLSFKMLHQIGFWDTDVIPEDYRIFFKAFYKLQGNVWVAPIFLKTSMDAPLSSNYWKSLVNKY